MRVLFCTDTYPPQVNGVSIVTALSVAGLSRRGWDCAVVAPVYPESAYAEWSGGPLEAEAAEVVGVPSVALPGYLPSPSGWLCSRQWRAVCRWWRYPQAGWPTICSTRSTAW
jgi:hypothetical protein